MVGQFIRIDKTNINLIKAFLHSAGESTKTFRYYDKRPVSIVGNHLYTCVYAMSDDIVAYGHLDKENDLIWLGIAVAENFRRKGIGQKMMEHLIRMATQLDAKKIHLSVDKDNLAAKRLYEKFNFTWFDTDSKIDFYSRQV